MCCCSCAGGAERTSGELPPPPVVGAPVVYTVQRDLLPEPDDGLVVEGLEGRLNPMQLQRVMDQHLPMLQRCFSRVAWEQPYLGGSLLIRVLVGLRGEVRELAIVENSLGAWDVERCVLATLSTVAVDPPRGNAAAVFHYPLRFRSIARPAPWANGAAILPDPGALLPAALTTQVPGLHATLYIDEIGSVRSAGFAADGPIDEALASELLDHLRTAQLAPAAPPCVKVTVAF